MHMRKFLIIAGIVLLAVLLFASLAACWLGIEVARRVTPPTPTPFPPPIVSIEEIRQAAELSTVKTTLSTDIVSTRVPDDIRQLFGVKEEIVLIAYGEVAAGFDLATLDSDALWVDGNRVQLHLPAPQILYVRLDNERTHVLYHKRSWFVEHDLRLEGAARQEAEQVILQAALDSDLLGQASQYGQMFFTNWFYSMGFDEVRVVVD
jgi:hypothetical protein